MDEQTKNLITDEINNNEICLFMKGTPDAPQCGFSLAVSNILKIMEVKFKGVNVLESQNLREGIKEYSEWPTIPQLYIKNEFIGGCDIVKEMYENGDSRKFFKKKYFSQIMKSLIYKTIIAVIAIVIVYEFTIAKQIKEITSQSEILLSKEGRKVGVDKIRDEIKKAVKKERYLSKEDAKLINQFISKIRKELKESED